MTNNTQISMQKDKLDLGKIHHYLSKSAYWAKGRTFNDVERSIKHSICFGMYHNNEQIGFARVVSDKTVFAHLMDVIIFDAHQHQGNGLKLMTYILEHPEFKTVKWQLGTETAQGFYRKLGFKNVHHPALLMVRF